MRSTVSALVNNRRFSRQEAVELHRSLQKQAGYSSSNTSQVWIPSYLDKFCKPIPLSSSKPLRPIKLSELELDCWHPGRALQGHLVAPAFKFKNLGATVLQDEEGNAARLFVSHVFTSYSSSEDVARLLPENAEVLVKEPCLVTRNLLVDGTLLWVANPACLEIVSHFGSQQQKLELSNAAKLANEELARGNTAAAIELYSRMLKLETNEQVLCVALAGRAQAWLKLGRYKNALDDAEQVLKLDPSHVESLRIKVEALWGLQQYRLAHSFSKQALTEFPELGAVQDKALLYKEQSERGSHDLSQFYIEGLKRDSPPDGTEFVGPIDLRLSPGRGRGLFLTSDVRKGDLLIVSNAVARVPLTTELRERIARGDSSELLAKVLEACLASSRTLSQIYSMAEAARSLELGVSSEVKRGKEAPSIELFRPNSNISEEQEGMILDVARIQNIIDISTEFTQKDDYSNDFVGFWTLPSFINHSCLPNVCVRKFGKAIFVFAARNMKRDTELLRSYGHSLHPYTGRINRSSFVCACDRCNLERRLGTKLQGLCEMYFRQVLAKGMYHLSTEIVSELESMLETESLSRSEKHWLRAMFPAAYISCFGGFVKKAGLKLPSADDLMEALHETAPGDMITLLMMTSLRPNATLRGYNLLMEECAASYGRTSSEVARAILEHLEAGRIAGSI